MFFVNIEKHCKIFHIWLYNANVIEEEIFQISLRNLYKNARHFTSLYTFNGQYFIERDIVLKIKW